jgi:hypothetical protein
LNNFIVHHSIKAVAGWERERERGRERRPCDQCRVGKEAEWWRRHRGGSGVRRIVARGGARGGEDSHVVVRTGTGVGHADGQAGARGGSPASVVDGGAGNGREG